MVRLGLVVALIAVLAGRAHALERPQPMGLYAGGAPLAAQTAALCPRSLVTPIAAPSAGIPTDASTAGITKYSFIVYGDTRGQYDGVALQPKCARANFVFGVSSKPTPSGSHSVISKAAFSMPTKVISASTA